jgi:hypothetical protein
MEKSVLKTICFSLLATLIISCNSKTKIEINFDENQKGLLVFDEKDTVKIENDSVIAYQINSGNHTFVLNNSKPQSIKIPSEGGILNLNKKRYVRMFQDFGETSPFNVINGEDVGVVVIDSMVYFYKLDSTKVVTDEMIKIMIKDSTGINSYSSTSMKLFNSDLFIPKDWDYGLSEDIPSEITVETNNNYVKSARRTKLLEENIFRFAAILTPSNFIVKKKKDIMNNLSDKKIDKEKSKNQMEF